MEVNNSILNKVEVDSKLLDDVVDKIVSQYTGALEDYVNSIKIFLEDGSETLTLSDLNNMALRTSSYLFFLSSNLEKVGIRNAVAEAIRDEKYNHEYSNNATGTIADKQAYALAQVKEEEMIRIIFDKAYRILKNRYSATEKLVDTIRKVVSARMSEMEISNRVS